MINEYDEKKLILIKFHRGIFVIFYQVQYNSNA